MVIWWQPSMCQQRVWRRICKVEYGTDLDLLESFLKFLWIA